MKEWKEGIGDSNFIPFFSGVLLYIEIHKKIKSLKGMVSQGKVSFLKKGGGNK